MAEKKKLSAEERKKVEAQIADLQEALKDVEDADTPAEEKAAKEELEREQAATAALFDRLGLTEEDFDLLVKSLAAGTAESTRALIREELGEEPEGDKTLADLQTDPKAPPIAPDVQPEAPPESQHWTRRKLFGNKDEAPDA